MSRHTLDLTRSAQIVRKHKILAGAITALGLLGNVAFTMAQQPVYTSDSLVVLSPSVNVTTQAVVVESIPVLADALHNADLGLSLQALQRDVAAAPAGAHTISISAHRNTAALAEQTASVVTRSYVRYVTSARNPLGRQAAQLLQNANTATVKPLTTRVYQAAGVGTLIGALIALVLVLAIWRDDPRLRERDAIADAIGVPVLASLRTSRPSDEAGWTRLLGQYEPGALEAALLARVLDKVRARGSAVSVLSLSTDPAALALGPQFAAYAAGQGIRTVLIASPGQDGQQASGPAAALHRACAAPATHAAHNLRLIASDGDEAGDLAAGDLTVSVAVVDAQAPRVSQTRRSAITVLAVTAGAGTADQLTRVAASSAADGREIAGVLVANPLRGDQTTGREPQLARPGQYRMPTRMVGVVTESRR